MESSAQVTHLMQDVGLLLEAYEVNQYGEKEWGVAIDESTHIHADFDREQSTLTLSAELAKVEPEQQLTIFRSLLQYNYLWTDTGGVYFALEPSDSTLVQVLPLSIHGLDVQKFGVIVRNFAERAEFWRDWISNERMADSEQAGDHGDLPPMSLRV